LEEHDLVYQERAVPEEEYSFKHVLMQETIYQGILRRHRAGLHQRVAEAMEALYRDGLPEHYEPLAYHYERSAAEEKAVEYLLKAGEKARRAYLNEDAIGYFRRALERLDGATGRVPAERVGDRGTGRQGEGEAGRPGKVKNRPTVDVDSAGCPVAQSHDLRLEALRGLGEIYQGIGKHSEAEEQFRQAVALAQAVRLAPGELARLYFRLGESLVWQGRS